MSLVDTTWATTIEKANIPVVGMDQINVPFYTNPDFYPEGQTNNAVTYSLAAAAKAAGAHNLAVIYCTESPSCVESANAVKSDAAQLGTPVVYQASIAMSAPAYTAQCVAAEQAHAGAVLIFDSSQLVIRVSNDCNTQGYKPIYVAEGLGYSNPYLAPSAAAGANLSAPFNNLPYYDTSNAAVQAMNAAVDKYYPGLRNNAQQWSALNSFAWYSGMLLADAVKAGGLTPGGTPTAAEVASGLHSLKGDTLEGTAPPLTFPAGQNHPINCWYTGRTQNHVSAIADNGQTSCLPSSSS